MTVRPKSDMLRQRREAGSTQPMTWLSNLQEVQPIAHAIGVIAFVCVLGMALGSLTFRDIGLGTSGVLFAGICVGHLGEQVDHHTLDFVKEVAVQRGFWEDSEA